MRSIRLLTCLWLGVPVGIGGGCSAAEPPPVEPAQAEWFPTEEGVKRLDHQTARLPDIPPIRFNKVLALDGPGGFRRFDVLGFSPDAKVLAAARFGGGPEKNDVTLWDVRNRKLMHVLPHPDNSEHVTYGVTAFVEHMVVAVAFVPPGDRLVTACWNLNKVFVWDVRTGKLLDTLDTASWPSSRAALTPFPDGKRVIYCTWAGLIIWDLEAKTHTALPLDEHVPVHPRAGNRPIRRSCDSVAFTADGSRFATAVNDVDLAPRILIWDAKTRRVIRVIPMGHGNFHMAYAPDGSSVAADEAAKGGGAHVVNVWDAASGKKVLAGRPFDYDRPYDLAFTMDGKFLLVVGRHDDPEAAMETGRQSPGGGVQIGVWQVATGILVNRVAAPASVPPLRIAISPDNKLLAVPGRNIDIYAIEYAAK